MTVLLEDEEESPVCEILDELISDAVDHEIYDGIRQTGQRLSSEWEEIEKGMKWARIGNKSDTRRQKPTVRLIAAEKLVIKKKGTGDEKALRLLILMLRDDYEPHRRLAIDAISTIMRGAKRKDGCSKALEDILEGLKSEHRARCRECLLTVLPIIAMLEGRPNPVAGVLCRMLDEPISENRAAVMEILIKIVTSKTSEMEPATLESWHAFVRTTLCALTGIISSSDESWIAKESAIRVVAKLDSILNADILMLEAQGDSDTVGSGCFQTRDIIKVVASALDNASPYVRAAALDCTHSLLQSCIGTAARLGAFGGAIALLGDTNEAVQEAALKTVQSLGSGNLKMIDWDPSWIEALFGHIRNGSMRVRANAMRALRKVCPPQHVHDHSDNSEAALKQGPWESVAEVLASILKEEPSQEVRILACNAACEILSTGHELLQQNLRACLKTYVLAPAFNESTSRLRVDRPEYGYDDGDAGYGWLGRSLREEATTIKISDEDLEEIQKVMLANSDSIPSKQVETGEMRCAAMEALSKLSEKENNQVFRICVTQMLDVEPEVRIAAIRSIGNLSLPNMPMASTACAGAIKDNDKRVRIEAISVLERTVNKDDWKALSKIVRLLDGGRNSRADASIRGKAAMLIRSLSSPGNRSVFRAVQERLMARETDVRETALILFADLAEQDRRLYDDGISGLMPMLEDDAWLIRVSAMKALTRLYRLLPRDSCHRIGVSSSSTTSPLKTRQTTTKSSLKQRQPAGSEATTSMLQTNQDATATPSSVRRSSPLSQQGRFVKSAPDNESRQRSNIAEEPIVRLGWKSPFIQGLVRNIISYGTEGSEFVRMKALQVLVEFVVPGDQSVVHSLIEALVHEDAGVRSTASEAMIALGGGDAIALQGTVTSLMHFIGTLQEQSTLQGRKVLERNDLIRQLRHAERIGDDALQDHLRDQIHEKEEDLAASALSAEQRRLVAGKIQTVMSVMSQIVPPGHSFAVKCICACFDNPSYDVRANALISLNRICDGDCQEALQELVSMLTSEQIHCRWAVAQAITILGTKGDREVLAGILFVLRNPDRLIRQDAVGAMFGVLKKEDFQAIVKAFGTEDDKESIQQLVAEGEKLLAIAEKGAAQKAKGLAKQAAILRAEIDDALQLLQDAAWVEAAHFREVEEQQRQRMSSAAELRRISEQLKGCGGGPEWDAMEENDLAVRALAMECISLKLGDDRVRDGVPVRLCKAIEGMAIYEKALSLGVSMSWMKTTAPVTKARGIVSDKLAKFRQQQKWI